MMNDDMELVRDYAASQSGQAFETLVTRHVNFVYSAALRQVRDPHLAEEITQAVFVILARKAGSLGPNTILPGWLHRTAGYCAADALKIQRRRAQREQEAYMQSQLNEPENETWLQIAPLLDKAIAGLNEKDRHAIVLRFFQDKSLHEIGAALGGSEAAAKKRVARALEKLRNYFSKFGVNSTAETIAGSISANSVIVAPAALAKTATAMALPKGAATGAVTLALVSETLKTMTLAKVKSVSGIAIAVLLAGTLAGLGLAFFPSPMQDDHNDRYQLEGRFDYGGNFVRDFILTVNGTNWAVHLVPVKNPAGSSSPQYEETVCLNGTIYNYMYFGKVPANSAAQNSGGATIYYGDSPLDDGTFADFVWVGLASGYYFHQATNNEVTPLSNMGPMAMSAKIMVKAQWQLNDAPPYLPQYIDYFGFSTHGIIIRPGVVNHQFDNGDWTNDEIRVLHETNINGRVFPTEYTCEQFRPNLESPTSTNSVDVEHQFWVTVNVRKIRL
ncbi:MAG TPA: sigma-70 family RNA polymerase sigma factor, partial [Pseudomonadales bacterium]|nr:sigma-70 family RNA polymerase sigma factor [Pseudomonadales bacterium]